MMRLAAVVRSSHLGGRGGETLHADEEQADEVRRYCRAIGAEPVFTTPELDVSGGLPITQRPGLKAAIEGVEAGEYDGIVAAYLSRLTRSRSGLEIWDRVEACGGHVHSALERIDTSTPDGRYIRDIHLANAVREREIHVVRNADRRRKTLEAGIWRQRQLPRGYTFKGPANDEGRFRGSARQLVPGPDADQVRAAFRDRSRGAAVLEIAERLGMTPSGVRGMLRNRIYLGELHDGPHVNPKAHQPLVSVEEFEAAQGQPRPPRARVNDGVALLAGLARCQACGHIMTRSTASGRRPQSYNCYGRSSAGRCPGPAGIAADRLEQHVARIAVAELDRLRVASTDARRDSEDARDALRAAERELEAYVAAVSVDTIGAEAFAAGARARRDAVEDARDRLRRCMTVVAVAPMIESGGEAWNLLDAHGRNALLRSLLEVVIVRRVGRGVIMPVGERVRVIQHGAGLRVVRRTAGRAAGIHPLPWLDVDGEGVLREPVAEESF